MSGLHGEHSRGRRPRTSAPAKRALVCVGVALGLLATTACAAGTGTSSGGSLPDRSGSYPIEVVYEADAKSSEGPYHSHADLIASDPTHLRYSIRATGFAPMLFIYDGQRLLVHDPEEYRPWSLYEAADEHPDQLAPISGWIRDPHGSAFATGCPSASAFGHQTILGHMAVGYHCAKKEFADGSVNDAGVVWLDQVTNLLLKAGPMHATRINEHPDITPGTFSTRPPPGVKVTVYAAQKQPGGALKEAPAFQLQRVAKSGAVSLADFAGQPVVLAFFSSDLVFDPNGSSCPGCVDALLSLQRLTSGGTDPKVLAVQETPFAQNKPGDPLIPNGLRLDVVNDPGLDVQHAYGLSDQIGFAFVGSDGKIHQLFNQAPTDQQVHRALNALH